MANPANGNTALISILIQFILDLLDIGLPFQAMRPGVYHTSPQYI